MNPQPQGTSDEQWAAMVALDWADKKHAWALQATGSNKRERGELKHSPEAIEEWISQLRTRFGDRPIAVCLEQSRGALLYALSKYANLVLFSIHPNTAAHFRKALYPSGAKDDPLDADVQLDLLMQHRDRLRRWEPDTEHTRMLQFLVEDRRHLVEEKTALGNRLTARLKLYFPQVLSWFSVDSVAVLTFLQRWPSLHQVQQARPAELRDFWLQETRLDAEQTEERLEQIRQTIPLTNDEAVIRSSVLLVQATVEQLTVLRKVIQGYEKEIAHLTKTHPDVAIYDSLPGAGEALTARLIAAMGSRRDRFSSAAEILSYSGIAPVIQRSGNKQWTHFRWACPKFVRQTFHEWAQHSIPRSSWARAHYDDQRARGKGHHAAIRSVAYKWIRILFRCWKTGTPYDEKVYLEALGRRRQPKSSSPENVNMQWKTSGGMRKFAGLDGLNA